VGTIVGTGRGVRETLGDDTIVGEAVGEGTVVGEAVGGNASVGVPVTATGGWQALTSDAKSNQEPKNFQYHCFMRILL
jgi:hypothetical protein